MLNGDQEFLKCLGVHYSSFFQVVQVSLFFCLFWASQLVLLSLSPIMGYLLTVLMSGHGELVFSLERELEKRLPHSKNGLIIFK